MAGSGPAMTTGRTVVTPVMPGRGSGTGIEALSLEACMPGLDPGIQSPELGVWMAGSGPAMTAASVVVTPGMPGIRMKSGDDPGIQWPMPGVWMAGSGPAMTAASAVVTPGAPGPRTKSGDDPGIQWPMPGVWMAGSGPAMTTGSTVVTLVMPGLGPGMIRASNRQRRESGWPGRARP